MISGQCFQRKRSKNLKKMHRITNDSIKNRNIHTKLATNHSIGLRVKNGLNKDSLLKEYIKVTE